LEAVRCSSPSVPRVPTQWRRLQRGVSRFAVLADPCLFLKAIAVTGNFLKVKM
jgi:hypothetical protein